MGKTIYLHQDLVQIALIQEIEKSLLKTAAAVFQSKGPCAQTRIGEKNLDGNLSNEVGRR
jgi:hypothetical protein